MERREVYRCENCNAPAKPSRESCEYCGVVFKLYAAPDYSGIGAYHGLGLTSIAIGVTLDYAAPYRAPSRRRFR